MLGFWRIYTFSAPLIRESDLSNTACLPARVPDKGLYGLYSASNNLFSIGQCPMNMDILAPKIGVTHMDLNKEMAIL